MSSLYTILYHELATIHHFFTIFGFKLLITAPSSSSLLSSSWTTGSAKGFVSFVYFSPFSLCGSKPIRLNGRQNIQFTISRHGVLCFFSTCDRIMRIEEFDHLLVMKEKLKIAMASDLPVGWWEAYHKIWMIN